MWSISSGVKSVDVVCFIVDDVILFSDDEESKSSSSSMIWYCE